MVTNIVMRHPQKGTALVTLKFSWAACLFGPLWAAANRLWVVCALLTIAITPIVVLDMYARSLPGISLGLVVVALYAAYMYICGKYAKRWVVWTLSRHGYIVEAEAEHR